MDRNSETVSSFNKHATAYNERYGNLDLYNDTYELFSSLFPARNSTVLDVGCGPGIITKYLLQRRPDLKVMGVDLAPNMIELAKQNNPTAEFLVMDCREISKLYNKFDAIICGFTIPYLSKDETAQLISDCAERLNPGGLFYFSLIDGKYEDSDYQYASNQQDRAFVYYYNSVKIMSMLAKDNLKIVQVEDFVWENNRGVNETHLVFIVKKS